MFCMLFFYVMYVYPFFRINVIIINGSLPPVGEGHQSAGRSAQQASYEGHAQTHPHADIQPGGGRPGETQPVRAFLP